MQKCPKPDIEQPLTEGNLIKSTDFFPKQAKDFDVYLVEAFNQVVDLTLHRHANAMNPFEQLEDPTQGRPLRRLVDLVWYRLVLTRSWLAQSTLRHGIDQQGSCHHHQQPLNTARFFQKQRRDKEQRVFEKPEASLGLGLVLVCPNHLRIAQLARLNSGP